MSKEGHVGVVKSATKPIEPIKKVNPSESSKEIKGITINQEPTAKIANHRMGARLNKAFEP